MPILLVEDWPRAAQARAFLRRAVVIATTVTAAACATSGAPERVQVATALDERTGATSKGLASPESRTWSAPPGTSIEDGLSIDEAVAIALWNNPDFQVALTSLGIARADLIEAGMLKNPVFSLLFPWGPKQLEFTVTWAIDAIWQRPKRIANARLNGEAAAQQLVAGGLRVVADVRLAFFEVLVSDRRLALTSELVSYSGQAVKLAEGQLRAGEISEFEAGLARADSVRLEVTRLSHETARNVAVVRLRAMLGLEPSAPAIRLIEPAAMVTDDCGTETPLLESALAARPEVRAAELQMEAAGARAGIEQAKIWSVTASLDANAKGTQGFEMGPGLAIELPILSQNNGGRARAAAEIEQAARRYIAVRATIAAEVGSAFASLTEARATASLLGGEVEAVLARARRQAEGLYKAGEISLLDLLQTRQRLIDFEATRLDAAYGVNRAVVRLEQALGRSCRPR
jgi:cobalt-zinc-cadmium efflux system outer membrane protein